MKKLLWLLLLFPMLAGAQDSYFTCSLTAVNFYCPGSTGSTVLNAGVDTHNLYIVPVGTPGTLTVLLQGSVIGDFTDAATCGTSTTTTANLLSCSGIYTRVRAKITVLTGFTAVNMTYVGVSSVAKNPPRLFAGAPTGSCNSYNLAVDQSTGGFYDCFSGSWNLLVAGTGSGNANYTGTQNDVACGTGTAHTLANYSPAIVASGTTVSTSGDIVVPIWDKGGAVYNVKAYAGADFGQQLAACLADISDGDICETSAMTGALAISSDPWAGISKRATVRFGPAVITCSASLPTWWCMSPPSGTTLVGNHTQITVASLGATQKRLIYFNQASDLEITGIEFNGNSANTDVAQQDHCVFINGGIRISIHGNYFHDCNGDHITLLNSSIGVTPPGQVDIYDNTFGGRSRDGVTILSSNNIDVHDNFCVLTLGDCVHGEPDASYYVMTHINIHDNLSYVPSGTTDVGGISLNGYSGTDDGTMGYNKIQNNILVGTSGILVWKSPHTEISGNQVHNVQTTAHSGAIVASTFDLSITGNRVCWDTPPAAYITAGIQVACDSLTFCPAIGMGNNRILNNSVRNARNAGINGASASYNTVVGNTITNVTPVTISAALAFTTSDYNIFSGNQVYDDQTVPTTEYMFLLSGSVPGGSLADANLATNLTVGTYYGSSATYIYTVPSPNPLQIGAAYLKGLAPDRLAVQDGTNPTQCDVWQDGTHYFEFNPNWVGGNPGLILSGGTRFYLGTTGGTEGIGFYFNNGIYGGIDAPCRCRSR